MIGMISEGEQRAFEEIAGQLDQQTSRISRWRRSRLANQLVHNGPDGEPEDKLTRGERIRLGLYGLVAVTTLGTAVGVFDQSESPETPAASPNGTDNAAVAALGDTGALRELGICRSEIEARSMQLDAQAGQGSREVSKELRSALAQALANPLTQDIPCTSNEAPGYTATVHLSNGAALVTQAEVVGEFSVGDWCLNRDTIADGTVLRIGDTMMTNAGVSCIDTTLPIPGPSASN
jgi:hypothetical protein